MALVLNPKTFTITDANVAAQEVTSFTVLVGTTTGGPYTTSTASAPLATLTVSGSTYAAAYTSLTFSPALSEGVTYFAVVEAVNAAGVSGNSPEVSFSLLAAPSAPTAFTVA